MPLNIFRLLFINVSKGVARTMLSTQQFIQLCLDRQGVTVLCSLDEQGHAPDNQGSNCVPIKRVSVECVPEQGIKDYNAKSSRSITT